MKRNISDNDHQPTPWADALAIIAAIIAEKHLASAKMADADNDQTRIDDGEDTMGKRVNRPH